MATANNDREDYYLRSFFDILKTLWNATATAVAVFYYSWGLFYARWGMTHRAFWYMNKAVTMNPNNPKGYYHRGALFIAVGQFERAILDFSAAIKIDPEYTEAYSNRGLMYTLIDKDAEAQQDFDRAAQLGADRANLASQADKLKMSRGPTVPTSKES